LPANTIPLVIKENIVRSNTDYGIFAANSSSAHSILVTDNEIYGHSGSGDSGLIITGWVQATTNIIHSNHRGMSAGSNSLTTENRLFNNSLVGIAADGSARVIGNAIYSNAIGLQGSGSFAGVVANNVLYANANRGMLIQNTNNTGLAEFVNNTIYQPVGDGIRLDSSARNNRLVNNIVWVLSGYGIYTDNNSQVGLQSDYNLFHQGADPNAYVGFWGGTARNSLADWIAASGKDLSSVEGAPQFVDIDGADNILGYVASGSGIDGGADDNFYLAKQSPAIDRGDTWTGYATDREGFSRWDDPATPNQGGPRYVQTGEATSIYGPASLGNAQNWRGDDASWALSLPFSFDFYGVTYNELHVSSNGLLQFGTSLGAETAINSESGLNLAPRIAPLWDDLTTMGTGDDIFIDSSIANQLTVRWNATHKISGSDVQFAVTLLDNDTFRFHYGTINAGLTPTVGAGAPEATIATLSTHNGKPQLENASSTQFQRNTSSDPQWASSVIGFSSQYSTSNWSAAQSLGAPNTTTYGDRVTAWSPAAMNGTSEFLTLGFTNPVFATGFTIRETYGNGFVTRVDALDLTGEYRQVWSGTDPSQPGTPQDFTVDFPQTSYLVRGLKIYVNTNATGVFEQIDAVQLRGVAANAYTENLLNTQGFYNYSTRGMAQNWKADDGQWTLNLPFAFPLYSSSYSTVFVSSNGLLQFGTNSSVTDSTNTVDELKQFVRIAPLWDDFTTTGASDNIFVDTSIANQVMIRWDATNKFDGSDVQFAATLFANGRVEFDYGPGNKNLTPTAGVSRGDSRDFELLANVDNTSNLVGVFQQRLDRSATGIHDIGAYEFRGRSDDTQAPTLVATSPGAVQREGVVASPVKQITLTFDEKMQPIAARSPAAYELRGAGPNGMLGDSDDIIYALQPSTIAGQTTVTLTAAVPESLPVGLYQLTVRGGLSTAIHDLAGNRLDGDENGVAGGDYVRTFRVTDNVAPQLSGANPLFPVDEDQPEETNSGTLLSDILAGQIDDSDGPLSGVAVLSAQSAYGTWQYSLDGLQFHSFVPRLVGSKVLLLAADSDTRIRFQPNPEFVGTVNDLVFRAWDGADDLSEGTDVLPLILEANSLSDETAAMFVDVENTNDQPSDLQISSNEVNENLPIASVVGTLSAIDPDMGDSHLFTLVAGEGGGDNDLFEIDGQSLRTRAVLDYESRSSFSIRVRATDAAGAWVERTLTVMVRDLIEVHSIRIGDGSNQRSMVTQLQVLFDGLVDIDDINTGAFVVRKRGAQGGNVTVAATQSNTTYPGKTLVTLTFSGSLVDLGGSLKDGNYELLIDAMKVRRAGSQGATDLLDGDRNGVVGGNLVYGNSATDRFFRLFGDSTGDRAVSLAEFNQFRNTYGKISSQTGYLAEFDFDANGNVSLGDFNQFRARYGRILGFE
jgi:hypothetical protein